MAVGRMLVINSCWHVTTLQLGNTFDPIRDECDPLVRIVSASNITAERNARLGRKKEEDEEP